MTYHLLGLVFILLGCLHIFDKTDQLESRIVSEIQRLSNQLSTLAFFKEIWFFGRTSFSLIVLVFLSCINWKLGLVAAGIFTAIVGIEYLLKTLYHRKRPFTAHQGITMLQPIEPLDSSFPSGDTLRAWYLALILPAAAGTSSLFLAAAIALAVLVTLGRLAMGVHYFTDTLAGAGLGMVGAGTTIWLWNIFNIL